MGRRCPLAQIAAPKKPVRHHVRPIGQDKKRQIEISAQKVIGRSYQRSQVGRTSLTWPFLDTVATRCKRIGFNPKEASKPIQIFLTMQQMSNHRARSFCSSQDRVRAQPTSRAPFIMGCGGSKHHELTAAPSKPKYRVAIIGLSTPGDVDKDRKGVRFDSTPIANGIVRHGMSCDLLEYTPADHDGFVTKVWISKWLKQHTHTNFRLGGGGYGSGGTRVQGPFVAWVNNSKRSRTGATLRHAAGLGCYRS